jgi:hypothetical protein
MKINIYRLLATLPGFLMGMNAVGWLTNPEETAKSLGMPLLEGICRTTQIGDLGALFVGVTILVFWGAFRSQAHWLYSAALFLGCAAVIRTIAALAHGTTMAPQIIVPEVILTLWLVLFAYLIDKEARRESTLIQ